jgi:hypothetical protein
MKKFEAIDIGDIAQKYEEFSRFLMYAYLERGQLYAVVVALLQALGMDEFEISFERMQKIGKTHYAAFLDTETEGVVKVVLRDIPQAVEEKEVE